MISYPVMGLTLAAALAVAGAAHATPTFPAAIQGHLGLSYEPPCSICHQDGITNSSTVTTPFGLAMRSKKLAPDNEASLVAALDALDAEGSDSDGDGVGDIAELRAGSDPNREGGESLLGPAPAYGCGARIAGGDPVGWASGLLVAVGLASTILRRRRQRPGSIE